MHLNIVVVTHNSDKFTHWSLGELAKQYKVIIVDSGSASTEQLESFAGDNPDVRLISRENVGFARGNNVGLDFLDDDCRHVLYLNPDATISSIDLEKLANFFESEKGRKLSAVSPPLVKYDFQSMKATSSFDSLGIYSAKGRWFDESNAANISIIEGCSYPDALCGAFILARRHALDKLVEENGFAFDPSFFMYKEDIDLSLRLKKYGPLAVWHGVQAFHCRGWEKDRKDVPRWARVASASNDLTISIRYKWSFIPVSLLKLIYVGIFEDVLFRIRR